MDMQNDDHPVVTLSSGSIVKAILFLILVGIIFVLKQLVLVLLVAIVIASSIEPGVRKLIQYHIPRALSVLIIYMLTIGIFASTLIVFLPPVLDDLSGFFDRVPALLDSVQSSSPLVDIPLFSSGDGAGNQSIKSAIANFRSSFSSTPEGLLRVVSAVFGNVLSFVLVIVFSFYFAVQEGGIEEFLRLVTPTRYEAQVIDLWKRSERKIGLWMQGQLILALLIGVIIFLGLTLFNVRYALLLGILATIFEIIPVFGAILSAIPGVGLAFVDGGFGVAVGVGLFYLIVQQFEGHLLQPLVVGKVVGLPPLLVLLSLIVGAELLGFMGILLAVPAAAVIQELATDLRRGKTLSKAERSA
jgi:predicted PurR-regulated permease PerM